MKAVDVDQPDCEDADADDGLTIAQMTEIDRRIAEYRKHPETSIPWETALDHLRRRG